jgi:hypothetical protein
MSTITYLSGFILSAIIATFVATSFFESPTVSSTVGEFSLQRLQAVNRDRKSDRLPVLSGTDAAAPTLTGNTTVVRKNGASTELAKGAKGTPTRGKTLGIGDATPTPKPPAPLADCERAGSPFADPALGQIIGRCIVWIGLA